MSAPHSIGRLRYGVATVESTMSGMLVGVRDIGEALEVGDLARRVRDRLDEDQLGLVGDRRGVVGRVGAERTNVVSTPKRRSVTSSWVTEPP